MLPYALYCSVLRLCSLYKLSALVCWFRSYKNKAFQCYNCSLTPVNDASSFYNAVYSTGGSKWVQFDDGVVVTGCDVSCSCQVCAHDASRAPAKAHLSTSTSIRPNLLDHLP